jgi:hypothetical protein
MKGLQTAVIMFVTRPAITEPTPHTHTHKHTHTHTLGPSPRVYTVFTEYEARVYLSRMFVALRMSRQGQPQSRRPNLNLLKTSGCFTYH